MWRFAMRNLASRPTRSILALLGLTVAIMGMVGLFSVAVGLERTVTKTFDRVKGLVAMQPGAPIPLFSRIPAPWATEIEKVPGVKTVRPEVWTRAHMVEGKMTFNPPRFIFGADIPKTLELRGAIYRDDIEKGRFLEVGDMGTGNCVVSRTIAEDTKKAVGDKLRVDGNELTIVGVYHTGSILLDVAIVYDMTKVREHYRLETDLVSSIYIETDGSKPDKEMSKAIRELFAGQSLGTWRGSQPGALETKPNLANLPAGLSAVVSAAMEMTGQTDGKPTSDEGLEVRSAQDWGARIQEFSADLDIFLYLMTGIGVVIALLSILNTMLMSVSERIIEFGILKANGWSGRDLLALIGWESALLGLWGGLIGCFLGWCGTHVVNTFAPSKLNLYASPSLLLFSLLFSIGLGLVGGLYPALWATRMTPMEAIRRG